jgi:hypothetical protein
VEVELDRTLLTMRSREDLVLLALCAFGLNGRHRVVPDDRVAWERWAEETLPADLCDEVHLVWDEGERRRTEGGPSEHVVIAPVNASQFDTTPLVITPHEALALLGRPLRVLLENGRNDRAFVLAFADGASHNALLKAEQEGWIVFETAGGIGELIQRIGTARDSAPREVFRIMYLCDSDAREPGAPSHEAATVRQNLTDLSTLYRRPAGHFGAVLGRRAAENYAPPNDVLAWACDGFGRKRASSIIEQAKTMPGRMMLAGNTGEPGSARRRLLAAIALKELHPNARGFLDMKEGRSHRNQPPKAPTVRTADIVWNTLDAFQQTALLDGFGASFSADFYADRRALKDETGEIAALLATLLERL